MIKKPAMDYESLALLDQTSTKCFMREDQKVANSKILIIDDEHLVIEVIKTHLNEAGFWNVVGMSDSIDAVNRMKRENPDLILLDVSMPDVSGNYLIQIARADPLLRQVPVMMVTADDTAETRERALGLGANDVLTKPLNPADLILRVEQALSRKVSDDTHVVSLGAGF